MLITRTYTVMDSLVVEISCVHSGDPMASHLVFREESRGLPTSRTQVLRRMAGCLDLVALLSAQGDLEPESGCSD